MTSRLNRWLLFLALLIGLPYYWLMIDDRPGQVEPYPVSIGQLRELAASKPGPAPTDISFEAIGWRYLPRGLLAAGQGVKLIRFSVYVFRLAVPNAPAIIIDTGMSAATARRIGLENYKPEAQARINSQLRKASLVVTLSDDEFHSGGYEPAGLSRPISQEARETIEGQCPKPRALAAGVVEIPVCGELTASRMVYVRLSRGKEYLLVGDVAPVGGSVSDEAGPSRLMDMLAPEQDRRTIHNWLRTIAKLELEAPEMMIISGHAGLTASQMHRGFPEIGTP